MIKSHKQQNEATRAKTLLNTIHRNVK